MRKNRAMPDHEETIEYLTHHFEHAKSNGYRTVVLEMKISEVRDIITTLKAEQCKKESKDE